MRDVAFKSLVKRALNAAQERANLKQLKSWVHLPQLQVSLRLSSASVSYSCRSTSTTLVSFQCLWSCLAHSSWPYTALGCSWRALTKASVNHTLRSRRLPMVLRWKSWPNGSSSVASVDSAQITSTSSPVRWVPLLTALNLMLFQPLAGSPKLSTMQFRSGTCFLSWWSYMCLLFGSEIWRSLPSLTWLVT